MSRALARPDSPLVLQAPAAVGRPPRQLHPWAWWLWALGAAGAASQTTNPLVLALIGLALVVVVLTRRSDAPWARSMGTYLKVALFIVGVRLVFQVVVGNQRDGRVLFRLPEVELPAWAAGITLGGPVTLNGVLFALYSGLQLGLIIACIGGANALANPRKALRSVPGALYEISVAVVIALALAPQLISSLLRVRRARRLRGARGVGWRAVRSVVVPVLQDAVDSSLQLAAGMESRGFGRTRTGVRVPWPVTAALLGGSSAVVLGLFFLLRGTGTDALLGLGTLWWGAGLMAAGLALVALGVWRSGRRLGVTRHRPEPWSARDTVVVVAALTAALLPTVLGWVAPELLPAAALHPSTTPPVWPALPTAVLAVPVLLLLPLALTTAPLDLDRARPTPAAAGHHHHATDTRRQPAAAPDDRDTR